VVDIAGGEAIFMDESERASRRGDLLSAQFQFLDDRDGCARKVRPEFAVIIDQMNISRVNILNRSAHFFTPATKVRKIVQTEMGEGLESFLWRRGIENDMDQAQKGVVFDDEL
jgi:hypothetical protein